MSGADRSQTIAFLGTGIMGAAIAGRLLRTGFRIVAWNRTAAKLAPLEAAGAAVAATPAEAAARADFICLSLADAAAVEQVLFGPAGVAEGGRGTRLLIDFSTLDLFATQRLAEKLRALCEISWIDSPVSGGVDGANAGKLIAFCGGEAEDVARARAVLSALTARLTHVGPVGTGQAMKLCNQLIVATNLLAIAEALCLARACGLEPSRLPAALAGGFADSAPLQVFGARMAAGVTIPKLGEIALMHKDIAAAVAAAGAGGTATPLASRALQLYQDAVARELGTEDLGALIRLYGRAE